MSKDDFPIIDLGPEEPEHDAPPVQANTVLCYFGSFCAGFGFCAFLIIVWLNHVYWGGQ